MFEPSYVIETLKGAVCVAKFTKADGTERTMRCTLIPSYLPEDYIGSGAMLTETTSNNVAVWDLDVNAWRSFRIDSLIEFGPANVQKKSILFG